MARAGVLVGRRPQPPRIRRDCLVRAGGESYNGTGGSIFMLALYQGGLNLMAGTLAARGTMAAIVTMLIMINGFVLAGLELQARRRGRRGPLGLAVPPVVDRALGRGEPPGRGQV